MFKLKPMVLESACGQRFCRVKVPTTPQTVWCWLKTAAAERSITPGCVAKSFPIHRTARWALLARLQTNSLCRWWWLNRQAGAMPEKGRLSLSLLHQSPGRVKPAQGLGSLAHQREPACLKLISEWDNTMDRTKPLWPEEALSQCRDLHGLLSIDNRNWHQLKGRWERRSAELLSAALVQLLSQGERSEVQALTEQALGWVNGSLKDPGCPHH